MQTDHIAQDIASALEGKPDRKGGWMVLCPAHADRNPSLHVTVRDDKVLVKCFAGCDQENIIAALQQMGLWPEKEDREPKVPPPRPGRVRFTYRDPGGTLLGYKERFQKPTGGKGFAWFLPDGSGGRPDGVGLYRAERVKRAKPDQWIYLVEGEKCVEVVEEMGVIAVSPPDGSDSWKPSYANLLSGRKVALVPDNDEPGAALMNEAAQALKAKVSELRTIRLPNLEPGEDIADWILHGGTQQKLERITERADVVGETPRPRLQTIRNMSLIEAKSVDWLWYPYLPLGKLCLLEGDPGLGKSVLSLVVASCLSRGWKLPGQETVLPPCNVLIMADEDGLADTVRPRLDALGADLKRIRPVTGLLRDGEEEPLLLDPEGTQALTWEIEDFEPHLVIIDPLFSYMGGKVDVNKGTEVRGVLRPLIEVADRQQCTIWGLRHLNKVSGASTAIYRGQGNIDFIAAARSVLSVREDPDIPGRAVMAHIKHNLSQAGATIAFSIGDGHSGIDFGWEGEVDATMAELFAAPDEDKSQTNEARRWLREELLEGPQPSQQLISKCMKDCGVSQRTVWRAKEKEGIIARKEGSRWVWEWPNRAERSTPRAPSGAYRDPDDSPELAVTADATADEDMEF